MDKIQGSVKSHIQIPKSVLEGFSTKQKITNEQGLSESINVVYLMDMDGNISEQNIKDANTQFGYYEDPIEKGYLPIIESAFGEIKAKIKQAVKHRQSGAVDITLTDEDILAVKKYCALCMVRSEKFVETINSKSLFIDMIANEPQNTVIYQYARNPEVVDKFFSAHNLSFLTNDTKINLILPQHGIMILGKEQKTKYDVFVPVAPNLVLLLIEDDVMDNALWKVGRLSAEEVDKLNKFAIDIEFNNNHKAIYAKSKQDLERYRAWLLRERK